MIKKIEFKKSKEINDAHKSGRILVFFKEISLIKKYIILFLI